MQEKIQGRKNTSIMSSCLIVGKRIKKLFYKMGAYLSCKKKSREEKIQVLCLYAVLSAKEKEKFYKQLKASGIKVGMNVTTNYLQLHKCLIELHAQKYWMDRVDEMLTTGTMLEWRGRFNQACYLPRSPGVR